MRCRAPRAPPDLQTQPGIQPSCCSTSPSTRDSKTARHQAGETPQSLQRTQYNHICLSISVSKVFSCPSNAPDTNLMGLDGIGRRQVESTKSSPNSPQCTKDLLPPSLHQTPQDAVRCSLSLTGLFFVWLIREDLNPKFTLSSYTRRIEKKKWIQHITFD